jgi:intraflagellar transport protein 81
MAPAELKKEITQLEQEKEQLITKINLFKSKSNKPEFQELLEATSMLRKEQEVEARYAEKLRDQRNQLEYSEQQLLVTKQKLMDTRRAAADNLGPEHMLDVLRSEAKRNRELCYDILGRELQDKSDRFQKIEMLLAEPTTTQSDLENLTNETRKLQRECQLLEDKLKKNAPADDKLAIYKTQATAVSKKKENKMDEVKKLDLEKSALEKLMNDKEEEYATTKGAKYMKRDDFKQYAASLRGKNSNYKKMKKQLDDTRSELSVLTRTEQILKARHGDLESFMKNLEEQKGIQGFSKIQDQMEDMSQNKEVVDQKKGETLQEISKIVQDIEAQLKEKKVKLAP